MDTGAFIIRHLAEVAKTSNRNVISVGGIVTAIANALSYGSRLSTLEPNFLGVHLDLGAPHHMHVIDTRGDTNRYPQHNAILFTLPNVEYTTVANKRNWNCDQMIIRATVLPREEQLVADDDIELDEGGDDEHDEEEEEDIDAGRGEPAPEDTHVEDAAIPPPPPPLYQPFTHEMGEFSSSAAYMLLDPIFLQSFSNLQMEVSGLRKNSLACVRTSVAYPNAWTPLRMESPIFRV